MTVSIPARRTALAGAFVVILLAALYTSNDLVHPVASVAAVAAAIVLIGAAVIGWEHIIANAEAVGLIESKDERQPSDPWRG